MDKFTKTQAADYAAAIAHLEAAEALFNKISKENQRDWDADRYACDIAIILEASDGETGLIPFVKKMTK
jgi:hypothetical protein